MAVPSWARAASSFVIRIVRGAKGSSDMAEETLEELVWEAAETARALCVPIGSAYCSTIFLAVENDSEGSERYCYWFRSR
jgi:hypothetical protein